MKFSLFIHMERLTDEQSQQQLYEEYIDLCLLADQSGFSVDTLRYYDKSELASPSARAGNGYRLYTTDDIHKLQFIRRAKTVGFSLESIRELLKIRLNKSASSCEHVKDVTARKLTEVTEKIAELEVFRQALKSLHDRCCGLFQYGSHGK